MKYTVDPGLYAIGNPDKNSPVLVTANYKLSFDHLRKGIPEIDAWILVLDTKGINVWCAAGKGTFGTAELTRRIASTRLGEVVAHRKIILPQLAGPGVSAHQTQKISGFEVIYGPIRSQDIPEFLASGFKATPEMREKTFSLPERAVLIPVELVATLKHALYIVPVVFLLSGLGGSASFWSNVQNNGLFAVLSLLSAIFSGVVLTPTLLPWLPGRAFSVKGFCVGLVTALVMVTLRALTHPSGIPWFELLSWFLIIPALSAYLAMNFTGASTYTSLSGVKKEMRYAVPLQLLGISGGLAFWLISLFTN